MTDHDLAALANLDRVQSCRECPKPVYPKGKGRPPLYCSRECRDKAWRSGRARQRRQETQ